MHRILTLSILLILFLGCNAGKNKKSTRLNIKSEKIFDAQTGLEIQKMKINNIEYSYSLDKNLDTVKLWTKDNKFITKEGFKIGTKWKEIPKELQDSTYKLPGFGYYVELKSGWNLGFCIGNTCTDNYPFNKSEVIWIEKQMNKRVKEHNSLFKN